MFYSLLEKRIQRPILFLLAFFFMQSLFAQTPFIEWQRSAGGTGDERAYSVKPTSDGGYIVLGTTFGSSDGDVTGNHGHYDYWVVKLNSFGVVQWKKCLGG